MSRAEQEIMLLELIGIKKYECPICGEIIVAMCHKDHVEEFKSHKLKCECGVEHDVQDSMIWN